MHVCVRVLMEEKMLSTGIGELDSEGREASDFILTRGSNVGKVI